jgi:hypothetical protein
MWAHYGQVGDYETWSGKIVQARFFPAWKEYYEYAVYRTEYTYDSDGKVSGSYQVFDHWEPTTRWHSEHWEAYSNIDTTYSITKARYNYFVKIFGNERSIKGDRTTSEHASRMIAGDPKDYLTILTSDFVEPITSVKYFENRIKAAPSIFNFLEVPKEMAVFEYPGNQNAWISNRLLGNAPKHLSIRKWDEMCARLGPIKRLNVIFVGFDSSDTMLAEWQKSKWMGGKKNDLVICKGPNWCKVFGWSESDICKRNIETLILQNKLDDAILPLIEKEIMDNYKKREFTEDFAYLTVEPQVHHWITFIVILFLSQGALYFYFHREDFC